jgi:hypothetical protein
MAASHASRRDDAQSSTGDSSAGFDNDDEVDATDRLLLQLKNGLFGVLYVMSKDETMTPFMALFWMFIEFVQTIGFAFPSDIDFRWYAPANSLVSMLTSPLRCVLRSVISACNVVPICLFSTS